MGIFSKLIRRHDSNDKNLPEKAIKEPSPPVHQQSVQQQVSPPTEMTGCAQSLVIPRPDHLVSRKKINTNVLKVMGRLIRHGFRAYLVGGSVRDIMLNRKPKDFDIVTDAKPEQVRELFRNSRMIGRRFRLVHVYFRQSEIIEISTFRQGVPFDPDSDAPLRDENTYGTPETDASRRDLTINGLFYDLETYAIYDYVGGLHDLQDKIVRFIGEPDLKVREDPIRMIRAIRHAAGTGFDIEPASLAAIERNAAEITKANPSRLRDELIRELIDGHSAKSLALMHRTGLLGYLIPMTNELLSPDTAEGANTWNKILANMTAVDDALNRRKNIPLPVVLAAFALPLAKYSLRETQAYGAERRRRSPQQEIRNFVKPLLRSMQVGRSDAETAAMTMMGYKAIQRAMAKSPNLPKSLIKKSYFHNALLLYQLDTRGKGERLARNLAQEAYHQQILLFGRPPRQQNRRKRGSRPSPTQKRPQIQNEPSTSESEHDQKENK